MDISRFCKQSSNRFNTSVTITVSPSGWPQEPLDGGLRCESPKGAIMIYSKSNSSCCFSDSSCSLIYLRMVSSSKPTVLTQYPLTRNAYPSFVYSLANTGGSHCTLAFQKTYYNAILNFGGTLRHMWIWSALKLPSNNSTPRCRQRSFIYRHMALKFPVQFPFPVLWIMTTWYLHSQRTCENFANHA